MTRTFSPCSNLETHQLEWAIYIDQVFKFVEDSVYFAQMFAQRYSEDVK